MWQTGFKHLVLFERLFDPSTFRREGNSRSLDEQLTCLQQQRQRQRKTHAAEMIIMFLIPHALAQAKASTIVIRRVWCIVFSFAIGSQPLMEIYTG